MSARVFNFSAGPANLPQPVLEEAQRDLLALPGLGVSPLEISHRSPWFEGVIAEAGENLRNLLGIPQTHRVLFAQGGATQQFSMVPMNLLRGSGREAEYIVTGSWGSKAFAEAGREGQARIVWSGKDGGFTRVPSAEELATELRTDAAYVHLTSNETIQGVEWPPGVLPEVDGDVPIVVDASSDFCSRPIDVATHGLLYAGAQKNLGPAGVTIVIVREDLLERAPDLPTMLDYRTFASSGSLHNTPPVFAIYLVMLVTRWLLAQPGGLNGQLERNRAKATMLYDVIDASEDFYRGHAEPASRSLMNVTWRLPSPDLETNFMEEAAAEGMIELTGHRSVGGVRASIYNAMPLEGVETLAGFMRAFMAARS